MLAKVNAERDAVDVHENRVFAIMIGETIADAPGDGIGIQTAIGNHDLRH